MAIDIFCILLLILAIFKGYTRGFIVAVFSVLAFILGMAASVKLSAVVAQYLGRNVQLNQQWLPVISFFVVFILVVFLVRIGAKIIEKMAQMILLGWANRLAGIILYAALYMMLLSVVLFYASQIKLISVEMQQASKVWPVIEPWAPTAMNAIGKLIPAFKDMFTDLQAFFASISHKIS